MSDGKHRATKPVSASILENPRESLLDALCHELNSYAGFAAEVLARDGGTVLFVTNVFPTLRRADIGCDYSNGSWWFTWVSDGQTIAPAIEDVKGAGQAIVNWLQRPATLP